MTREEALEVMWKNLPSDKSLPVYEALQTLIPELRPKFKAGDIIAHNFRKRYTIWYEPDCFIVSVDEKGYNLKDGGFIGFGVQDEYTLVGRFNPNPTDMDKECIGICKLLNSLPTIQTFESCSGHLKDRFSVWFFCDSIEVLSRLGRAVEHNYSDGKWEVVVDSTDTHPYGVFWLRSKSPFQNYEEMNESLQSLIANIRHWFKDEFDSYFIKPEDTAPVRLEEEDGEKYPVVDYKLMGRKPAKLSVEDKQLVLKDLSARVPYKVNFQNENIPTPNVATLDMTYLRMFEIREGVIFKPYLRPLSSMTEAEKDEEFKMCSLNCSEREMVDFFNKHYLDYNGLIEKGLAIEAPEGMYKKENLIMANSPQLDEQKPINQCNTHEPTLDEARKWNEAYEKGYSLGCKNGRNEQKPAWSEEDEKIRKKLIEYFSHYSEDREWWEGITPRDIITYLEMQKPSFRQIHDSIMWDSGLSAGIELGKKGQKVEEDGEKHPVVD